MENKVKLLDIVLTIVAINNYYTNLSFITNYKEIKVCFFIVFVDSILIILNNYLIFFLILLLLLLLLLIILIWHFLNTIKLIKIEKFLC